ncbi:MAG: hypothetical protein DRP11_00130 [Candidatus Aenigmatarchaeota archaeon]|nr:MAG: hypothetical protein DRP11_00130 [Candidatus Aenigmarchaeota archaeon]
MAVTSATVLDASWEAVRSILASDTTISNMLNDPIRSAYTKEFIEQASGMPLLVIHKPNAVETSITLNNSKVWRIEMQIDSVTARAEDAKLLADAVRNALETSQDTLESNKLFNFRVVSETEDFDIIGGRKIVHYDIMTVAFDYTGD